MTIQPAETAALKMEVSINATPAAVWETLTAGIGGWWPADFYAGGTDGKRQFVLEARPGGRMYEEWDDGGGTLWGTVVTADPGKRLQVIGYTFPNWGGPSQWFGTWELSAEGDSTRLSFEEASIGRISDGYAAEKDKGWRFLWNTLKAQLEGDPPPAWSD